MTTSSATLVGRREGCAFGCLHNSCCLWGDRRLASSVANPACPGPLMVALKYVPSAFQRARPCHLPATFSPPVFSLRTGKVRSTYPCLLPSRLRLMNLRQASFPFRCALSSSSSSRPVKATALLLLYSILPSTQKTPLYSGLPSSQGLRSSLQYPFLSGRTPNYARKTTTKRSGKQNVEHLLGCSRGTVALPASGVPERRGD